MRLLLLVPPVLLVALALDQGGFEPSAWVWSGALAAWVAATAAVTMPELRVVRAAWAWVASACAVVAWISLSWLWSDRRAQTVLEVRRTAIYAAAVLALVVVARRGTSRYLLVLTHVAISAVVVYALARYLTDTRTVDAFEGTLLSQPLGYANALGALAAIGLVIGIGVVAEAPSARQRAAAAATAPALGTALLLTSSRGAAVALGIGVITTFRCADEPAPFIRSALLVAPGSVLAVAVAATSRLSDQNAKPYTHAALVVGIATIAGGIAAALAVARTRSAAPPRRHVPRPVLAAALGACVVAAAVASGFSEPRTSLWGVASHQFGAHIALGSGAGTFAIAWVRSGLVDTRGGALDAHSLYLETLAELGLVGLVLLLTFLAVPLAYARRAPVAVGAYAVVLVHAGLDWDWEMPAVMLAGLCCAAAALAAGGQPRRVTTRGRAAIVVLALALGALSIAGARSSSEPGVLRARSVAVVLGARVPVPVLVSVPVLRLRSGLERAGRERVAVAQVRLDSLRRHREHVPRVLLRVRAMADLHAVLLARGAVLPGRRAVLTARRAVLPGRRAVLATRGLVLV